MMDDDCFYRVGRRDGFGWKSSPEGGEDAVRRCHTFEFLRHTSLIE